MTHDEVFPLEFTHTVLVTAVFEELAANNFAEKLDLIRAGVSSVLLRKDDVFMRSCASAFSLSQSLNSMSEG